MFERFTDRARRVLVLAQDEARSLNHNYIGTDHILLGLLHEGEGVAAQALIALGVSLEDARSQIEMLIGRGEAEPTGHIPFTPRAKKVQELALRESLQLGHSYIGTEHLLLGLVREGEGIGAQVLAKLGVELTRVREQVIQILSEYLDKKAVATYDNETVWAAFYSDYSGITLFSEELPAMRYAVENTMHCREVKLGIDLIEQLKF